MVVIPTRTVFLEREMCKLFVLALLVCNLFSVIIARTSDELRVTLPNGSKLVGRALQSHNGRPIKAFMGIPYAKPPLNHLRFKVNFHST